MEDIKTVDTQLDDDWNDLDLSDLADDSSDDFSFEDEPAEEQTETVDTPEADEADHSQESVEEAEPTETQPAPVETAEADHSFKLKYMGEEKEYSRDEMVGFAQKGIDYDRIKGKLDEANAAAASNAEAAEFVRALAADSGISVAELIETVTANRIARTEGITVDEAKGRIRLEKREKALADREKALEAKTQAEPAKPTAQDERRAQLAEFFKAYPGVKPTEIPVEVFQTAHKEGISIIAAYARHEVARAQAELAAERQNKKNKERSAGSASTSGKHTPMDAFDAAWYDGT